VHSSKDLPTAPADGIVIAAISMREDPRDALVARSGLTLGDPRSTSETSDFDTPARAATVWIVGRSAGTGYSLSGTIQHTSDYRTS